MLDVTVLFQLVSLIVLSTVGQLVQSLPCDWTNGTGRLIPLISGDITTATVSSEADCRNQCVIKTSFICAAVNYKPRDNSCELLTENNKTATADIGQTEWSYSNRPLCAGQLVQSLPCDWTNGTGRLIPLISGDITTATVSSEADCRNQCVSKTSFICAAVNYKLGDNSCELLTENNKTATADIGQTEWSYSNRPLCAGIWFPWMTRVGQTIESDDGGFDQFQSSSLKECMGQCVTADSTVNSCNSIVISRDLQEGDRCQLHNVSVGESNITSEGSNTLQYFGKPPWYRDDSTGISDGFPVKERNVVGRAFRLFNNLKLTLDGYLVGWKYYFKKDGNVCGSSSYVTIFGKRNSDTSYKYVTSTLLQPENKNDPGVRFQFHQQALVPVKAKDLLGIYTINCSPTNAKHLVSLESVNTGPENVHKEASFDQDLRITTFTDKLKLEVSLKAFVAGYTKLPANPSTTHRSVTNGQIRLVIPSPGSPESQGAVLYRIICSTDQDFGQSFQCHPELIPVGTPEVVLEGLDVTSPLYAKVEVLRNFNGQEISEDGRSTQSPFCAGRQRLADSDISINITENDAGTVSAILSNHNMTGDACAASVTISYQQMNTSLPGSIADPIQLNMNRTNIYEFKMFLTLADGYEMLYWSGSVDLTPPTSAPTTSGGSSKTDSLVVSTPISRPVNAAAIVVPIIFLLLIGVAIGLLVLYMRRKRAGRSSKKASSLIQGPSFYRANNELEGTINASFNNNSDTGRGTSLYPDLTQAGNRSTISTPTANRQSTHPATEKIPSKPTAEVTPMAATKSASFTIVNGDIYSNVGERPLSCVPVSDLHRYIQQEKAENPGKSFQKEFKELSACDYAREVGTVPENKVRNRFRNIIPFDQNRVKLPAMESEFTSDYINASHITDFNGVDKFLASQGPLPHTLEDFWRMIHMTKAEIIVMTTMIVEEGKRKCEPYWPDAVGDTKDFGKFKVTLREESVYPIYTIRNMVYSFKSTSRTVTQYHYTEWYDKNVPTAAGLLSFRSRVKQTTTSSTAPTIVHCSAGVGRTGTYIALDMLIEESNKSSAGTGNIDVFSCVDHLRKQRVAMVQTHVQYAFLYEVLSEALTSGNTSISCSNFSNQLQQWNNQKNKGGRTIIQEQYDKLKMTAELKTCQVTPQAQLEENKEKNRDQTILPVQFKSVRIWQPISDRTDYINAIYCNSYHQRDGFIATQTPLTDTVQDFWAMIVEQASSAIIYFNDCKDEKPFWPLTKDEVLTAGDVTVTNTQTHTDHQTEESSPITTSSLNCSRQSNANHLNLFELKIAEDEIVSCHQLVSMCQKLERYMNTKNKPVTVVCRNGSRLSGLFIIAMNLYLRTRIEQQLDVVLEIKLAQNSRPSFIPDVEQFERLYEFVEFYLSEFSTYSNY